MFRFKIIKYVRLFFFFAIISGTSLYAGSFYVTPTNLNNYSSSVGLIYSSEGSVLIDSNGTMGCSQISFCTTTGTAKLILGSFNIKDGQQWNTLAINVAAGSGTLDIYVLSATQVALKTILAVTTSQSIQIDNSSGNGIPELANGAPFYVKIVFNGTSGTPSNQVTSISASYSGNELMGFPAPFQISSGSFKIVYEVNVASTVLLEIYDNRGKPVKTILDNISVAGGQYRYQNYTTWDGKDSSGRVVNTGIYTAVIHVTPTDTTNTTDLYISTFRFLVVR